MGNVMKCMVGKKLLARVRLPDGKVVEYNYGVHIAMLMTLHPGYLVVKCSLDPFTSGERRHIKVMDEGDRLSLGKSYMMYPIPRQYEESFSRSFRISSFRVFSVGMAELDAAKFQKEGMIASGYKESNDGHKEQKGEIEEIIESH
ncbi:unnamed protein product [Calypogeia fissa]